MINVRCQHCSKLLCRVSRDYYGIVQVKCRHCKKLNSVSVAIILRQMNDSGDRLAPRAPAQ
jgi:phage FluMu protein Com